MKPAVRGFWRWIDEFVGGFRSGEVHGLVKCIESGKKKVSKRDGGAKREMRARAQVGRVLICERRHKGKSAREMSAIGSVEAWREQWRRDPAKGIRRMVAAEDGMGLLDSAR